MAEMPGNTLHPRKPHKETCRKKINQPNQPYQVQNITYLLTGTEHPSPNKETRDSDSKGLQVTANAYDLLRS